MYVPMVIGAVRNKNIPSIILLIKHLKKHFFWMVFFESGTMDPIGILIESNHKAQVPQYKKNFLSTIYTTMKYNSLLPSQTFLYILLTVYIDFFKSLLFTLKNMHWQYFTSFLTLFLTQFIVIYYVCFECITLIVVFSDLLANYSFFQYFQQIVIKNFEMSVFLPFLQRITCQYLYLCVFLQRNFICHLFDNIYALVATYFQHESRQPT